MAVFRLILAVIVSKFLYTLAMGQAKRRNSPNLPNIPPPAATKVKDIPICLRVCWYRPGMVWACLGIRGEVSDGTAIIKRGDQRR
jgi:hypothetical protein